MKKIVLILTALCMILACAAGSAEDVSAAAVDQLTVDPCSKVLDATGGRFFSFPKHKQT